MDEGPGGGGSWMWAFFFYLASPNGKQLEISIFSYLSNFLASSYNSKFGKQNLLIVGDALS